MCTDSQSHIVYKYHTSGKTDLCLWCDGYSSMKRKRDGSPGSQSKRAAKEKEVDELE